jgi:hypothetical protein
MKRWIFAVLVLLALSPSPWAQDLELHLPGWFQVDRDVLSPTPEDIAKRLLALSTLLSSEAKAQSIELSALRNSLQESRLALGSCQRSLDQALIQARRRNAELWLWRGATVLGLAIGSAGLAWGLSK